MTIIIEPDTSKPITIPPGCTILLHVTNGTPGNELKVYRQVEGQAGTYEGSVNLDIYGEAYVTGEGDLQPEIKGKTDSGQVVGHKLTYSIQEWSIIPPIPIGGDTIDFIVVPGGTREVVTVRPVTAIMHQDVTSTGISRIDYRMGIDDISKASSDGPSGASIGPCCPCSSIATQGTTGGAPVPADGAPPIGGDSGSVSSRGLPMLMTCVHNAKEMFKGPWGWYRSFGIYRKLFEQSTITYFGHVSIFRENATRVAYLKVGVNYQSAAGVYDSLEKTASGWFEKAKEGIYYEYNTHGNLKRVLDPNRNEQYYLYDDNTSSQKLMEIKAPKGLRPYFYYNDPAGDTSLNTRIALRDPTDSSKNKYIYFEYDVYGYMIKNVGPEGCHWYYDYDRTGSGYNYKGKITKIIDPDGYTTYFGFDTGG